MNGETPLFLATLVGSKSNIIALIDKGANVNYETFDSSITPLFKARTYDVSKLLLQNGADISKMAKVGPKNENMSVIEYVMKYNTDCAKAILDQQISLNI